MPRGETKVRIDSFIMDYTQTLDIDTSIHRNREGKESAQPDNCPAKSRVLVIYDDKNGDGNAWDTPFIPKIRIHRKFPLQK